MAQNKIIISDNKSCQLVTDDEDLLRVLRSILSYKMQGVEYTPRYQAGGWNGKYYLISKKGVFSYGLLSKVTEFLKERHQVYTIQDLRQPLQINKPIDISAKLKLLDMVPRDYQDRIVDIASKSQNGIIRACTGSGKSLVLAMLTAKLNKPTIIYVIGLDLLKQMHDLFSKVFDEPIGYIGDGVCDIQRINIATIWTIGSALNIKKKDLINDDEFDCSKEKINVSNHQKILDLLKTTKVHCLDECHVVGCATMMHIYKNINPEHIYGFSGTPFRDDGTDLLSNSMLGEQIVNVSASELIEKGVLAQPIIKFVPVPKMSMPCANYPSIYKEYIAENIIRNNLIVKNTLELIEKKYTPLVLFKNISHGQTLFDMMTDQSIKCEMLYGNDSLKRRTEVKEMLESKKIDAILASVIFDIGLDLPILSALVLGGGGKSNVRALQRIGRCIRKYPGKKFAAIIDFYDQIKFLKKHSQIRCDIYESERGFKVIKCKEMKKN